MTPRATIDAVAMALPQQLVSNREIADHVGVDEEWIAKRTGTQVRPWARPEERMTDFAAEAAREALEKAALDAADLDLVLVATSTADEITPNAAPLVAGQIGATRAGSFDIGSACTGWLAALAVASGQIESGRAEHAVVIGADFLSRFLDLSDRDTTPLFADGAGAAVLSAGEGEQSQIGPILLRSDAKGAQLIRLERSGRIQMQGHETFKAAVSALADATTQTLEHTGLGTKDIDLFVYHQANSRIIQAVGRRLAIAEEKVVDYVGRFGNSSTATLPIALATAEKEERLHPGSKVLLASFGGGFTWGACVIRWPDRGP